MIRHCRFAGIAMIAICGCSESSVVCEPSVTCRELATIQDLTFMLADDAGTQDAASVDMLAPSALDGSDLPSWTSQAFPGVMRGGMLDVWGSSASSVFAVGADGTILHTTDGGKTWDMQKVGGNGTGLLGVWGSSPSDVFVVGEGPPSNEVIWRTNNGGKVWTQVMSPAFMPGILTRVSGSGGQIYAVGLRDRVLRSIDNGATWAPTKTLPPTVEDFWGLWLADFSGRVWVGGTLGALFHTDDGGDSWVPHMIPQQAYGTVRIWGIANHVFLSLNTSEIFRSDDAGKTFTQQNSNTNSRLLGIWGLNELELYVVGDFETILHTTNGGKLWSVERSVKPGGDFWNVWGSGPADVYAAGLVGNQAVIFHKH